jgi:hypothetical protein
MPGPDIAQSRAFLYSLIGFSSVRAILDVGCGDGYDLLQMALLAQPDTHLTGLDHSPSAHDARTHLGTGWLALYVCRSLCLHRPAVSGRVVRSCLLEQPAGMHPGQGRALAGNPPRAAAGWGGMITQAEYDAFLADIRQLSTHDRYFYSITLYAYAGWKA